MISFSKKKTKCGCGNVMIISLANIFKEEQVRKTLRRHITEKGIGCIGKKAVFAEGTKQIQCVHIKICDLEKDLVSRIKGIHI